MKTWKNIKDVQDHKSLFVWRHRNINQFYSKIFTWLLGGFVAGILTSLFFLTISMPDLSLPTARIAFFIVTVAGIISSFYRAVVNGLEYRLTDKGVVHIHPYVGIEPLAEAMGKIKVFSPKYEFIPWTEVREISDEDEEFILVMKEKEPVNIGVSPLAMYNDYETESEPVIFTKWFEKKNPAFSSVLKLIVKKGREAKKNNGN